jgi:hypothetical protein
MSYSWLCHWLQVTQPPHPTPDLIQPFVTRGREEAEGLRLCFSSNHPYSYGQLLVGFPLLTKLKRQAGRAHCKGSPSSFCKQSTFQKKIKLKLFFWWVRGGVGWGYEWKFSSWRRAQLVVFAHTCLVKPKIIHACLLSQGNNKFII